MSKNMILNLGFMEDTEEEEDSATLDHSTSSSSPDSSDLDHQLQQQAQQQPLGVSDSVDIKVDVFPAAAEQPDCSESSKLSVVEERLSAYSHLATFAIIGVLVRYGLQRLFGPSLARVTDVSSILFIDLPANMLGCFFMGCLGIALNDKLTQISQHLALGLSTGLMGSITTFSSWSQSMLKIITAGYWLRGICGFLLGMELAMMSLLIGVDFANLLLKCFSKSKSDLVNASTKQHDGCNATMMVMKRRRREVVVFVLASVGLWGSAWLLLLKEKSYERKKLWLACTLAPLGVWLRWWLSILNGISARFSWLPTGTLLTNVAASLMAFIVNTLQVVDVISSRQWLLLSGGFQLGMLGCMSTVSTLAAEIYWLAKTRTEIQQQDSQAEGIEIVEIEGYNCKWRSYFYAGLSILVTLLVGLVCFSTPVWLKHVDTNAVLGGAHL